MDLNGKGLTILNTLIKNDNDMNNDDKFSGI